MDVVIAILKYTGAVISGAYGVYATLTDFREERNGKKLLSRKGYIGIALLVFSTVLSLSSDAFKDFRDHLEANDAKTKQDRMISDQKAISANLVTALDQLKQSSSRIDDNLHASAAILGATSKILDPLPSTFTVTTELEFPTNQDSVSSYVTRINSLGIPTGRFSTDRNSGLFERPDSFPDPNNHDELWFSTLVDALEIEVSLSRDDDEHIQKRAGWYSSMFLKVNCNADEIFSIDPGGPRARVLTMMFIHSYVRLRCASDDIAFAHDDSSLSSLKDFDGLGLVVWVTRHYNQQSDNKYPADEPLIKLSVSWLTLTTPTGRQLSAGHFRQTACSYYGPHIPCYVSRFRYRKIGIF